MDEKLEQIKAFGPDKEDQKRRKRDADSGRIHITLSREANILVKTEMENDGWQNMSAFIEYKLFGDEDTVNRKFRKAIRSDDTAAIRALYEEMKKLNRNTEYFNNLYNKMLNYMYSEAPMSQQTANQWYVKIEKLFDRMSGNYQSLLKRISQWLKYCKVN